MFLAEEFLATFHFKAHGQEVKDSCTGFPRLLLKLKQLCLLVLQKIFPITPFLHFRIKYFVANSGPATVVFGDMVLFLLCCGKCKELL